MNFKSRIATVTMAAVALTGVAIVFAAEPATKPAPPATQPAALKPLADRKSPVLVPDSKGMGGETDSVVQVANLIYAGTKSSKCFSDHFLLRAEEASTISTSRRFHSVKLAGEELFDFPLVIMTGEGSFELLDGERENLRKYVEHGGFLLASASCSSPDWDKSFRAEMAKIFADHPLKTIGMEHPVFHTIYDVTELKGLHSAPRPLEGISIGERLGILYSNEGLNDTAHTQGCCCCGGNEITNDEEVNVNILAYALLY